MSGGGTVADGLAAGLEGEELLVRCGLPAGLWRAKWGGRERLRGLVQLDVMVEECVVLDRADGGIGSWIEAMGMDREALTPYAARSVHGYKIMHLVSWGCRL